MSTWDDRFRRRETEPPKMDPVERAWRFTSPTGKVLACWICQVATGIEVRVFFEPDDLLHSRLVGDLDAARRLTAEMRDKVLEKGSFTELRAEQ